MPLPEKKMHHTQIRMTEEAWEDLRRKAALAELTVPSYIRWAVRTVRILPQDVRALILILRRAERRLEGLQVPAEEGERPDAGEIGEILEVVRRAEKQAAGMFGS